jgi:hypothetical protein
MELIQQAEPGETLQYIKREGCAANAATGTSGALARSIAA